VSEQTKPHRLARSVGAVVAGFVATALLSLGTDVVMHATGVFPPWGEPMSDGLFVWATVYRVAFTVLGGLITARLAPRKPMAHVLVLGAVGIVAASAGVLATWNQGPEFGPKWYPIMLVVTALPCVWAGGVLAGASDTRPLSLPRTGAWRRTH
jgi:peptidoglycan/LPS O-acetylase OafA/YrhL